MIELQSIKWYWQRWYLLLWLWKVNLIIIKGGFYEKNKSYITNVNT